MGRVLEVFAVFLRLGLTSFGGPIAHLGYFRAALVERRRWLSEQAYADLVALANVLPGPASSQVGMMLGLGRRGLWGLLAAWTGFTLPSALLMALFGLGLVRFGDAAQAGWLHGLQLAAVAVVAQAVGSLWRTLATGRTRGLIALGSAVVAILLPAAWIQVVLLGGGALVGWRVLGGAALPEEPDQVAQRVPVRLGYSALLVFAALLALLPVLRAVTQHPAVALFDSFYRVGALVFGGGHVVLPLLEREVVPNGWVSREVFLAGYGAAQAVPGPLFTFSAYLGAVARVGLPPLLASALAVTGIFLPSALLVIGVWPFWNRLRSNLAVRSALSGVNATVVGLLLAALYQPLFTTTVQGPRDFALVLALYGLLVPAGLPSWLVVGVGALAGWGLGR